jgi:hypothetical protein
MQRSWRRHVIVLLAFIFLPAAGLVMAAEIDQGTWEAGVLIAITNYANDSTLDDSYTYGGRGAYFFRTAHGIELDINTGSTDRNTTGVDSEFDLTKVFLNYVHNIQMKKVSRMMPLMTVGFGKFNVDDGMNNHWATTLQLGAGTRVSISRRSALRFDATVFRWRGDNAVTPSGKYFSLEFTLGWSFFIGSGA